MKVVVPKETDRGERRVALTPEGVGRFKDAGVNFAVQSGAGQEAGFSDATYAEVGAAIATTPDELYADAGVVVRVRAPSHAGASADVARLPERTVLIGLLQPLNSPELLRALCARRITAFAMELVPRITRAQRMDALSSQATVAGYKAALLAASLSPRFFPMLMTAAGTIHPAKVLVIGAGVAGLQAIATSRRLGAQVQGFDIRPAVKDQVESLGATWVGLEMAEAEGAGGYAKQVTAEQQKAEHEHLHKLVSESDVVITTAAIPGKRAPILITEDMVADMHAGAVIVDLAAETGGNCSLTRPDQDVRHESVIITGPTNLPSTLPLHASQMYSRNIVALLQHLLKDGNVNLDLEDEITRGSLVTHEGEIVNAAAKSTVTA